MSQGKWKSAPEDREYASRSPFADLHMDIVALHREQVALSQRQTALSQGQTALAARQQQLFGQFQEILVRSELGSKGKTAPVRASAA